MAFDPAPGHEIPMFSTAVIRRAELERQLELLKDFPDGEAVRVVFHLDDGTKVEHWFTKERWVEIQREWQEEGEGKKHLTIVRDE